MAGVAVNVTGVPYGNGAEHCAPQLTPDGEDVTVPEPVVLTSTTGLNTAPTALSPVSVTVQLPVPLHPPPLQPANTCPVPALALKVTALPWPKLALQTAPQLMPAGDELTLPRPCLTTLKVRGNASKVAVTATAWLIVTLQLVLPLQAPLQPPKR